MPACASLHFSSLDSHSEALLGVITDTNSDLRSTCVVLALVSVDLADDSWQAKTLTTQPFILQLARLDVAFAS